jgi:NitT/TauT family transport system substrate-binding protein
LLRNARRTAIGLLLTAVLVIASACTALGGSSTPENTANGALEKTAIKVSVVTTIDSAPFWIAQENGYFKAEGLDVTGDVAATGDKSMTKAISGEADIAATTYTLLFVAKSHNAADLRLVADASSASPQSNEILTLPTSPVKHIEDLAGHKVAITSRNAPSDILTRSVLKDHNIDPDTVNWVQLSQPSMAAALQHGDVDAVYQAEPYATQASTKVGAYSIADVASGATLDFPIVGFVATGKWVQDNPKTMAAFQRAMDKATRTATADRAQVERMAVKYGKVEADVAALMKLPNFHASLDARRIQRVPDVLLRLGSIPAKVDAAPMIAPQITG